MRVRSGLAVPHAARLLAGLLQMLAGLPSLGDIMRFVSRSVITGFVNALALLIFIARLPELIGVPALTHALVAAGLAIIYLLPRLTRVVPSPLVAIVLLTVVSVVWVHHRALDADERALLPSVDDALPFG